MVADKFGRYWELADLLTSPSGQSNLNALMPMGLPFRLASDGVLDIRVNAINWQKSNGALLEVVDQGPTTLADNSTNFIYFDDLGVLQISTTSFPNPASLEFFACGRVITNAGEVTEIHPYLRPSPVISGGGGGGGSLLHQDFPVTGNETVFVITDLVASALSIIFFIGSLRLKNTLDYVVSGANNQTITLTNPPYPVKATDSVTAYYQQV